MAKEKNSEVRRRGESAGMIDMHALLAADSADYRRRARDIEYEIQRFIARHRGEGLKTGVVRIPVVVHVVYNAAQDNFTLTQVQQQIDALNRDFRLQNADAANIPPPFQPAAADTRIEFALAKRDPNCGATTGMTTTFTSKSGFLSSEVNLVRQAAPGWPPDRYLNIWIAPLVQDAGYGTGPAAPPQVDGVMIASSRFGTIIGHAPWDLGRTATLMCGLYLDLIHIWGNLVTACADDMCADTPLHYLPNHGAPIFPHHSIPSTSACPPPPHGDMFMNHMDSHKVHDASKLMFTADQALRMHACLANARAGLLASDSLVPPTAPTTPDLWIQGAADDGGEEPFAGTAPVYCSDDIWVRNAADGLSYQDHQNPRAEQQNHVYVRVRNRGCPNAGSLSGTVRLYWAKASPSLAWPSPWTGGVTIPSTTVSMGGEIVPPQPATVTVTGGGQQIVSFPWMPPDPSDYASFGADQTHFCLCARVETSPTAPFGMTVPETGNFVGNVVNNNNIAWKNVSIVDIDGPLMKAAVVIGQFSAERRVARYAFEMPTEPGPNLFDWGFLLITLRGKAMASWRGALRGQGFQQLDDGRLMITGPGAWFAAPPLKPKQFGTLHLHFVPNDRSSLGRRVFGLDLTERDAKGRLLGAQRFLLKTESPAGRPRGAGMATFDGVDWLAAEPGCGGCRDG
ncbi:MAG TPA: hypothetical protein VMG08_16685 [Allosphingosinicella sp.]|nr:hypothetical protein [Allosphingosinicella sp.]